METFRRCCRNCILRVSRNILREPRVFEKPKTFSPFSDIDWNNFSRFSKNFFSGKWKLRSMFPEKKILKKEGCSEKFCNFLHFQTLSEEFLGFAPKPIRLGRQNYIPFVHRNILRENRVSEILQTLLPFTDINGRNFSQLSNFFSPDYQNHLQCFHRKIL